MSPRESIQVDLPGRRASLVEQREASRARLRWFRWRRRGRGPMSCFCLPGSRFKISRTQLKSHILQEPFPNLFKMMPTSSAPSVTIIIITLQAIHKESSRSNTKMYKGKQISSETNEHAYSYVKSAFSMCLLQLILKKALGGVYFSTPFFGSMNCILSSKIWKVQLF